MKSLCFAIAWCALANSVVTAEEVPKSVFDDLKLPVIKDIHAKVLNGMVAGGSLRIGMNRCDDAFAEFQMPEDAKVDWAAKRARFEACFNIPGSQWRPCLLKEVGGIWSPEPATLLNSCSFEWPDKQPGFDGSLYVVISHHRRAGVEWIRLWAVRMRLYTR